MSNDGSAGLSEFNSLLYGLINDIFVVLRQGGVAIQFPQVIEQMKAHEASTPAYFLTEFYETICKNPNFGSVLHVGNSVTLDDILILQYEQYAQSIPTLARCQIAEAWKLCNQQQQHVRIVEYLSKLWHTSRNFYESPSNNTLITPQFHEKMQNHLNSPAMAQSKENITNQLMPQMGALLQVPKIQEFMTLMGNNGDIRDFVTSIDGDTLKGIVDQLGSTGILEKLLPDIMNIASSFDHNGK